MEEWPRAFKMVRCITFCTNWKGTSRAFHLRSKIPHKQAATRMNDRLRAFGYAHSRCSASEGTIMSSYIDNTLLPNETVLYRAHVSVWSLFSLALLGLLAIALCFGLMVSWWNQIMSSTTELWLVLLIGAVGIIYLIAAVVRYRTTEFAVTDKRIIAKTGLISRKTIEMFLDKVESLNVEQSVMGRILDYGTVGIRGTGSTEEAIRSISAPLSLRKQFMGAADMYRQKVMR